MYYAPSPFFNGLDFINIQLELSGTSTALLSMGIDVHVVAVNDPPFIAVPVADVVVPNNVTSFTLHGVYVLDRDVSETPGASLLVSLQSEYGILAVPSTYGIQQISNNGGRLLILEGDIFRVNRALADLRYTPVVAFAGTDVISIVANDQGNTGQGGEKVATAMVNITVTPSFTSLCPSSPWSGLVMLEDGILNLDAFSLLMPSTPLIGMYEATLSSTSGYGLFSFMNDTSSLPSAVHVVGQRTSILRLSAGFTVLSKAFEEMRVVYSTTPNWHGLEEAFFTLRNSSHGDGSPLCSFPILIEVKPVNDPPAVEGPEEYKDLVEDTPIILQGLSVSDPDTDYEISSYELYQPPLYRVSVSTVNGTIKLTNGAGNVGMYIFNMSSKAIAFEATWSTANAVLGSALEYVGDLDFFGEDLLTVTVDDLGYYGEGGALQSSRSFPISILPSNDPPTVKYSLSGATIDEGGAFVVDHQVIIQDPDATQDEVLVVSLESVHGSIVFDSEETTDVKFAKGKEPGQNLVVFQAPIKEANIALASVLFMADAFFYGRDSLSITVTDAHGASGSQSIPIKIQYSNTLPTLTLNQTSIRSLNGTEDATLSLAGIMSIGDADAVDAVNSYVDVELMASAGAVLEVQNITTYIQHVDQIQAVTTTATSGTIGGYFHLAIDLTGVTTGDATVTNLKSVSGIIRSDAVPMRSNEVLGSSGFNAAGASVQAAIEQMSTLRELGITVDVDEEGCDQVLYPLNHGGCYRRITFHNAPSWFPLLIVTNTSLTGAKNATVSIVRTLPPTSITGAFALSLDGINFTPQIPSDSSESVMAAALHNLSAVDAVRVERIGPTEYSGYTWMVTFLRLAANTSGADIPLLTADTSGLVNSCVTCDNAPNVSISRKTQAFGIPTVYELRSSARHVNHVYSVNLYASNSRTLYGSFTLGLDLRAVKVLEGRGSYATTLPLYPGTVGMIKDQATGPYPPHSLISGSMVNESIEERLYTLGNWNQVRLLIFSMNR